ncbi:MAG: hypothetical protein AB8H80_10680 [Planctomycetota bacterium]
MVRAKLRWTLLPMALLASCAIPNTLDMLGDSSPPAEFGRPAWVRAVAGVGGWVGGIVGGVASVVLLPITYPLSLAAGDELTDHAADEVILFPAMTLAAGGHAALGLPADLIDWTFRRVWIGGADPDPIVEYDFIPMSGASIPRQEQFSAKVESESEAQPEATGK